MKNCLFNYVGIDTCYFDSESGYYINDLPGISNEMVANIGSKDQQTFIDVFNKIQKRAYLRLQNEVLEQYASLVRFNEVAFSTSRLIKPNKTINPVSAENNYRGVYVSVPYSKYAQYNLNKLQVYNSGDEVTTNMYVFDCNNGSEIYTKEIVVNKGLNTFDINEKFSLNFGVLELFICVDGQFLDSIETVTDMYEWYEGDCACEQKGRAFTSAYYHEDLQIYSGELEKSETALYENIKLNTVGKGVCVVSEITCSIDEFICQHKSTFLKAWFYLLGAETMKEKLGSPNVNYFTISNTDATEFLRLDFEKEFSRANKSALKNIKVDGEGYCMSCDFVQKVSHGSMMP